MVRIGDRAFLFAWQRIRAATQPGPEAAFWQVSDIDWHRYRYSHMTPDHSVLVEVHSLESVTTGSRWKIIVVAEHWWDDRRNSIRNQLWSTLVSGSRLQATDWIIAQARSLEEKEARDDAF